MSTSATYPITRFSQPTAIDAVTLLDYLIDHLPPHLGKSLFDPLGNQTQPLRNYGVTHEYFNYTGTIEYGKPLHPLALLFCESERMPVGPGIEEYAQLFWLQDYSWLLWQWRARSRQGIIDVPTTMHFRTSELYPVFNTLGIQGVRAVSCIRHLLYSLNAPIRWSPRWHRLSAQVKGRFSELT